MGVEIQDNSIAKAPELPIPDAYRTTDAEMAAALMSIGHKFVRIEEKKDRNGRKTVFVFEHKKVRTDLTKWLNGELQVDPRLLLNNLSDLKNLVHNKDFE